MGASTATLAARRAVRGSFGEVAQGRSVTYRAAGFADKAIDGVFRAPHVGVEISPGGAAAVSMTRASLGCVELADLPAPPRPDHQVLVAGKTWAVVDHLDDGEGGTTFTLTEIA